VAGGTWIAHGFGAADPGGDTSRARVLPAYIRWVLLAELILLAGFTLGWEVTRASRAGWAEFTLLAVAAEAMGVQAAAVKETGLTDVSTTFLTGTLTGLVSSLASPGQDTPYGVRRLGVLLGLLAGAGLSGLLIATAAASAPALTLAALVIALALASVPLPLTRSAVPGQGGQQDHGKKEPGAGTPSDAK
jgi:uncharacterized membrane protein YoaK (UPF0700 family)